MHEPEWINFAERRRELMEQQRLVQWRNRAMIQKRGIWLILLAIGLFLLQQSHLLHMGLGISLRLVTLLAEVVLLGIGTLLLLVLIMTRGLRLQNNVVPKDVRPGSDEDDTSEIFHS